MAGIDPIAERDHPRLRNKGEKPSRRSVTRAAAALSRFFETKTVTAKTAYRWIPHLKQRVSEALAILNPTPAKTLPPPYYLVRARKNSLTPVTAEDAALYVYLYSRSTFRASGRNDISTWPICPWCDTRFLRPGHHNRSLPFCCKSCRTSFDVFLHLCYAYIKAGALKTYWDDSHSPDVQSRHHERIERKRIAKRRGAADKTNAIKARKRQAAARAEKRELKKRHARVLAWLKKNYPTRIDTDLAFPDLASLFHAMSNDKNLPVIRPGHAEQLRARTTEIVGDALETAAAVLDPEQKETVWDKNQVALFGKLLDKAIPTQTQSRSLSETVVRKSIADATPEELERMAAGEDLSIEFHEIKQIEG